MVIERIEPMDLLSYRRHPYAVDPTVDYTKEPPTLVTFTLKDAPGNGTLLTVVESGADRGGEANAGGDREAVGRGAGEAQNVCRVDLIAYLAGLSRVAGHRPTGQTPLLPQTVYTQTWVGKDGQSDFHLAIGPSCTGGAL